VLDSQARLFVRSRGYRIALWTIDTRDWQRPAPEVIAQRILQATRDGSIVLMHDGGGNRANTVAALALALPRLLQRGVRLVTLSQALGLEPLPGAEVVVAEARGARAAPFITVTVSLNGQPLPAPVQGLVLDGHLLLAAVPVLEALGLPYSWDAPAQALRVESLVGTALLRANSRRFSLDGRDAYTTAPSLLVEGRLFAPARLLARLANATAWISADLKKVDLSLSRLSGELEKAGERGTGNGGASGGKGPAILAPAWR
jgi:hypothetical protein